MNQILFGIDPGNAKAVGRVCYAAEFRGGALRATHAFTRETARAWSASYGRPDVVAIEMPQMDARSRKVPPNVLIGLAWNGALVASALDPVELMPMPPSEWKGSVNKAPHHLKIWRRILTEGERYRLAAEAELSEEEAGDILRAASEKHARTGKATKHVFYDSLDAVGVGLVALGRMRRAGSHIE